MLYETPQRWSSVCLEAEDRFDPPVVLCDLQLDGNTVNLAAVTSAC